MAWKVLLQVLFAQVFNVLSWPSFTLLCPLYASFWAMESDSLANSQQCLTFWVLFALLAILEKALAKLLLWLPFWPYVKGVVTVLLVVPYFGGASYVYKCFVRTHSFKVSHIFCLIWNILFFSMRKSFSFSGQNNFVDEIGKNIIVDGQEELQKSIVFQVMQYVLFVSKAHLDDIFLVELWAVWRGLVLAFGLGIKAVWVESDSMSVVKTINGEQSHRRKADRCLKHIWLLLRKFENYQVSHSWRETNKAADFLSKMVLEKTDVLWPYDFPSGLQNIIKDDAQGRIYCRRQLQI
ncbi:hypothetical protein GH714_036981 [Hevea brasiliensis]|uniref:HVA22-like protein n=1 Tax=Hevea brasiliensis TaxID=3981 RepID=A0A6A6NKP9_HEVBR|nr:hypothetical protein GH714_036981 [Hevea brasiliensis]